MVGDLGFRPRHSEKLYASYGFRFMVVVLVPHTRALTSLVNKGEQREFSENDEPVPNIEKAFLIPDCCRNCLPVCETFDNSGHRRLDLYYFSSGNEWQQNSYWWANLKKVFLSKFHPHSLL